jgi:hypothetical protein
VYPSWVSRLTTASQLELSAQAPWTRTMLGLGPLAVVPWAGAALAEPAIPTVTSSPAAATAAVSAAMRLDACRTVRVIFMVLTVPPRRSCRRPP